MVTTLIFCVHLQCWSNCNYSNSSVSLMLNVGGKVDICQSNDSSIDPCKRVILPWVTISAQISDFKRALWLGLS